MPGVKEDVTEIILNLKGLVVSSDSDEPVTMYLRKQGPGEVTAADIAPPAGVEVHNPDLHIATLNGKGRLEIELVVERGRGYVPAPQNKQPGQEIGRIPVDSIYSPVLKVTYAVEATRVEQRTDFDRLVVDVETKPSIAPRDAIASAGSTLVELFGLLRELNVDAEGIEVGPSPAEAADIANFSMPIEDMDLTVRSYNCLKREGIHTVGELVARSEADLLDIRNFGAKSIDEVKIKLAGHGPRAQGQPARVHPHLGRELRRGLRDRRLPGHARLRRRRVQRRLLPGDRAALRHRRRTAGNPPSGTALRAATLAGPHQHDTLQHHHGRSRHAPPAA